jgi:hypothetical protein
LHSTILKDDRVARDIDKYTQALTEGLVYVNNLPLMLYQRLVKFCPGLAARKLENSVLRASYQAAGFVDRRVFSEARKPVNQMHVGDVPAKLAALKVSSNDQATVA